MPRDLRPEERIGSKTAKIGTLEHFRWLKGIVVTVLLLNIADAAMTIIAVSTGAAEEANPLLHDLVHNSPELFVVVKMLLVTLGSYLLWRFRKRPAAVFSIFFAFLVYYVLLLYHLQSLELGLMVRARQWFGR